jgi:hypothetical protein
VPKIGGLAVALLLLVGCEDGTSNVFVEVRSDLRAPAEVSEIRVQLGTGETQNRLVGMDTDLLAGVRVAEFESVPHGRIAIDVVLLDPDGLRLVGRRVLLELSEDTAVTVAVQRSCLGISCGDDQTCVAGACTDPACSPLDPAACGEPECSVDADCDPMGCGRCAEGLCLVTTCDGGMPDSGPVDTSVPDASRPPPGTTMRMLDVEGVSYSVDAAYDLDAPLALVPEWRTMLTDNLQTIAFPRVGSAFPPGAYVTTGQGAGGTVMPSLLRFSDGVGITVAGDAAGPDQHVNQMVFSEPTSGFGDFLYLCSSSEGGGDGIFTVAPSGGYAAWSAFNNCNGMTFDFDGIYGGSFASPMYVDIASATIERRDSSGGTEVLWSGLPRTFAGYLLLVGTAAFDSRFFLVAEGDPATTEGYILSVAGPDPWTDEQSWDTDLANPHDAAFGTSDGLGDFLFVSLRTGQVRAYRPDGSSFDVVDGLSAPTGLGVEPATGALFILDAGRGQILRLSR